ncbi:MAG: hypothetical protein CVU94_02325 [Firmicutes bacterium HGW-Firmicutes-19]|nr:MAG: hypothetical protein CVU94_02325 [Firmicutes bacterium HGW-Firmicutes-19]
MLTHLGLTPSFGFGDRLGLATPGHIAAIQGTHIAPIFAQQSVRENARTGRTPLQVMNDAKRAVVKMGWQGPWGADADHLKTLQDLPPFVDAGFTFFTVDPGEFVDNFADSDSLQTLREKFKVSERKEVGWDQLSSLYLSHGQIFDFGEFDDETLLRAEIKYGKAIRHTIKMYHHLLQLKESFDFEVSVDETNAPTTPLEHFFIANELSRSGVQFTSLAPRFIGRFEKGVDYIGDLGLLDTEMAKHAAVTALFGTYKLSLHSGSDKFSVYPLIAKYWGNHIHVKTAGTSYLEALRVIAVMEPNLFKNIWNLALARYPMERATYHVSAEIEKVPNKMDLPALLDEFNARQILHVTFGSALALYGNEIKDALNKHADLYTSFLEIHFSKHLNLLK